MSMLLADSMLQGSADLITFAIVGLLAWLGSRYGVFLATVWGLQALLAVVAAFAITDRVDDLLVWAGMTNEFGVIWRQSIAFVTSLSVVAIATRVAIGSAIPEQPTNYPPLVDLVGGGFVGAMAGLVVAGILQVVLAMAPLPEWASFDHSKVNWDLGKGIIELVGSCAAISKDERAVMMDGEPGFKVEKEEIQKPQQAAPVDPSQPVLEKIELPQWSEVFADVNWNQQWDKGEKYLDADQNGEFSWVLRSNDLNTSKTRDIGLRERYKLGPWVTVRVLEKQEVQRLQRQGKLGEVLGLPYPPPGGFAPGASAPAAAASAVPAGVNVPAAVPAVPLPADPAQPFVPGVAPGTAPAVAPGGAVAPPAAVPAFPTTPAVPGAGAPPGVPKQPGQPAGAAAPAPPPAVAPAVTPSQTPPVETPGRANETPRPAPPPQTPFVPVPGKK